MAPSVTSRRLRNWLCCKLALKADPGHREAVELLNGGKTVMGSFEKSPELISGGTERPQYAL